MHLKSFLFSFSIIFSLSAFAQEASITDACRLALLEAEQQRNPQVYSQCGFDEERYAVTRWSLWAQENNAYQAMYELCIRYPKHRESIRLCELAVSGGNGPALLNYGNKKYDEKNYIQAIQSYTQALRSPLLTDEEKGQISEKIGILYLDKNSTYYNPKKGLPLIEKATHQRSALANNIIGVYSMLGLEGEKVNMEKSFEHLWRSVLLGCPNAEENLGLFYLLHKNKIDLENVKKIISNKILKCSSSFKGNNEGSQINIQECDCDKVFQLNLLVNRYSYRLLSAEENYAVIIDKANQRFTVTLGTKLPDGSIVKEIRKTAVILLKGNTRQILNLMPDENCLNFCEEETQRKDSDELNIAPYHLSFTPSECSSILYYAERLVDTNLPFVGKQECGYSGDLDAASQLLLQ